MSIKALKQNLVMVITVVVLLLAAGLVVWQGQKAAARNKQIERELETQGAQLATLLQGKPAPTHDNIKLLRIDREQLEQLYPAILQAASRVEVRAPELRRPVEFQELLARKVKRLRQTAAEVGVEIPPDFAFGFGRYASTLPCQGATGEDCNHIVTRLAVQLLVVEKICDMLYANKIIRLDQIRRAEVEAGTSGDSLEMPVTKDTTLVYKTLPFEFRFAGTTEKLRSVLNGLSQSDWFFSIRSFKAEAGGSEAGSQPGPLAVTMQIDLLEFPPVAAKTGK